jgi:hypothetical protein
VQKSLFRDWALAVFSVLVLLALFSSALQPAPPTDTAARPTTAPEVRVPSADHTDSVLSEREVHAVTGIPGLDWRWSDSVMYTRNDAQSTRMHFSTDRYWQAPKRSTKTVEVVIYNSTRMFDSLERKARKIVPPTGNSSTFDPHYVPQLKGADRAYNSVKLVHGVKTAVLGFTFENATVTVTVINLPPQDTMELAKTLLAGLSGLDNIMPV